MPAVRQPDVGPEPVEDLLGQLEEDRRSRGSSDRSARLDTVGTSVTRTLLTLRSITSAAFWEGTDPSTTVVENDQSCYNMHRQEDRYRHDRGR